MAKKLIYSDYLLKICTVMILLLFLWSACDNLSASSKAYDAGTACQTIYVNQGDSLWSIAAKHVNNKDDVRTLILAIKQINGLNNDVTIHPGQSLKIPRKAVAINQ
ncbi:MAG: LysM domain-containing protein [Negativicutes bacterium]|nr:LysM domain-containing protein [Negativicutes bacterium]